MADHKFGMAVRGKTVHFAIPDGKKKSLRARCDKRLSIPAPLTDATIEEVTCNACQRYADYKNHMTEKSNPDPPEDKPTEKKTVDKPKTKPKKSPEEVAEEVATKADKKNEAKADLVPGSLILEKLEGIIASVENIGSRVKALEEGPPDEVEKETSRKLTTDNYKEHMRAGQQSTDPGTIEGKQFKSELVSKDSYRVVHIATGKSVFNNVPLEVIETVLKYLNNMKIQWTNKFDPVPKDFVSACAAAFKAAYSSHGLKVDIKTDPRVKPPRVIKRRGEKTPEKTGRKIKRRSKPDKEPEPDDTAPKYGFRPNSNRAVLGILLERGSHYCEILDTMKKEFDMTPKEATGKLRGVIRKLLKTGHSVMHIRQQDEKLDFYHIVERIE